MAVVRIVTDSAAEITPDIADELGIIVVPWRLHWAGQSLLDDPSLRSTAHYRETIRQKALPSALPPSAEQLESAYKKACREADGLVAIHASGSLCNVVSTARRVRMGLMGRCDIQVVDSHFMSVAMGELVIEAARAAQAGLDALEISRMINGMIPSVYMAFYMENLDQLKRREITLDMTNVKGSGSAGFRPLLLMEDGEIVVLQRSRNRGTPVERYVDFLREFEGLGEFTFVHTGLNREAKDLLTQVEEQAPHLTLREHIYGPVLWTYLGPTALGAVVRYEV